jgi:hypothetical protein
VGAKWTTNGAWIFITLPVAQTLAEKDLAIFIGALELELQRFLHTIDFESFVGVSTPLIRRKLIDDYGTKEKLLAERPDEIKRRYGAPALAAFQKAAEQKK